MLIFNLKKQWYEKILRGEKTIEYREVKSYWTTRLWHNGCLPERHKPYEFEEVKKNIAGIVFAPECVLTLGYTKRKMFATIVKVEYLRTGKDTDLAIDAPVYAIHLLDAHEATE